MLTVQDERAITTVSDPYNGSTPFWCFGSRTMVREGDEVFIAIPEHVPTATPLCNTRWRLHQRQADGTWAVAHAAPAANEREPTPLLRLPGGRLLLSTNPAQRPWGEPDADGRYGFHCDPLLLVFQAADVAAAPRPWRPQWGQPYEFSEHSYRAVAADGESGAVFLAHQVPGPLPGEHVLAWTYADGAGQWRRQGILRFPMRGCYAQIALRGRAVHVMAISDEVEPNLAWRQLKYEQTGRKWDYDFRQVFYTFTPDVLAQEFTPPLTVASRDETAGHIRNLDLWLDPAGDAHLLYHDLSTWYPFVRDRYFPGLPITVRLQHVRVSGGRVAQRQTLLEAVEDLAAPHAPYDPKAVSFSSPPVPMRGPRADWAAFQSTPDGRLWVVWTQDDGGQRAMFARVVWPELGAPQAIPVREPLATFFVAGPRAGNAPSFTLDLYGHGAANRQELRYAQVALPSQ